MWEILVFLLNALLFVLIGLQLPTILEALQEESAATLLGWAAAVSATVILTRFVFAQLFTWFIRFVDRREVQRQRRSTWRIRVVNAWCGMRGAVSLAAALALDEDFPHRDIVLFLTFSVIFATLVLQGLTLPLLIKALHIEDDGADEREELIGRRAAVEAALARLTSSATPNGRATTRPHACDSCTSTASGRFATIARASSRTATARRGTRRASKRYQKMVRSVLTRAARAARRAAQRAARSPTRSCTGSSASSTSRTSGWRSRGALAQGASSLTGFAQGAKPAAAVRCGRGGRCSRGRRRRATARR